MKKALVLLLILAFVGVMVFAEDAPAPSVTVGGWGRAMFEAATGNDISGSKVTTDMSPNWGGLGRVGFNVNGKSQNMGFSMNIDSNGNTLGIGDQAKIWAKMFDMVTLQVGRVQLDTLRGKIGNFGPISHTGAFDCFGDEDAIFQRFNPNSGMTLDIQPVEGLFIGLALDTNKRDDDGLVTTAGTFANMQIGAGYTIKDIGQIRVQYIGGNKASARIVNAAFALTAVQGLLVDIGAKINVNADVKSQTSVTVGASYSGVENLGLVLRINAAFGETATLSAADATTFGAALNASYKVADPLTVGAAFSYKYLKDAGSFGLAPYLKFGYSNGYALVGFRYTMNLATGLPSATAAKGQWSIPIGLEYWF